MTPRSSAAARPHRARRGEGERLRNEVIDAAEELLIERGAIEAVSMRAIASRVGVTPAAIYLHFADKDELFFAVCSRRFAEFGSHIAASLQEADGTIGQLEAMGRAYIAYGLEHREHYGVLFGQRISLPPDVGDITELPGVDALGLLVAAIDRGMQEGVLAPGDPAATAIAVWATVHGFVQLVRMKEDLIPGFDVDAARESVLQLVVRGLLA